MKGCKIYHIFPEKSLGVIPSEMGELIATLLFDQETIQKKKNQAISEVKKEYAFVDEIKELFEDESQEEIHLLRGVRIPVNKKFNIFIIRGEI